MRFETMGLEREDISIIHEKAEKTIESSRVKEEDFLEPNGPYTQESVERDLEIVRRQEASFESGREEYFAEQKKLADIFEAIVIEHGELSQWFGENAFTIKTSKFDDYANNIDAVIEFREDDPRSASYLGMGVDVTFSTDSSKKFDRIRSQIEKGYLSRVKYFHSDHMNMHGQLSKLPEVVVGADKRTVLELAELWKSRQNRELARHRIQIMMLHQMQEQLLTFAMYATSLGRSDIAQLYHERHGLVMEILKEKEDIEREVGHSIGDDKVHSGIMSFLAQWREEIMKQGR